MLQTAEPTREAVRLPVVLRWFWAASAVLLAATLVVAWVEWHAGWLKARWDPLQFPNFIDLLEYVPTFRMVHTAAFFHNAHVVAYPPFGGAVFGLVYATGHAVWTYLASAALVLGFAAYAAWRVLVGEGIRRGVAAGFVATVTVASFPLWRMVPQGNIELYLWACVALGVWAWMRDRDGWAAVLWGLAAAMKLYPMALMILLLRRGRWWSAAVGVLVFVVATLGSMLWIGPSLPIAWHGALGGVFGYQGNRVAAWTVQDLAGNHSLFTLVKVVAVLAHREPEAFTRAYYVAAALGFLAIWGERAWKLPRVNRLLLVTLFMVMLPPLSYFHTLVHLYAPWLLLAGLAVRAEREGAWVKGLTPALLLMLPLFASFTLMTFPRHDIYAGIVQSAMLVVLFVVAVVFPFETPAVAH